jgi:hypothetical protein
MEKERSCFLVTKIIILPISLLIAVNEVAGLFIGAKEERTVSNLL